MSQGYRMQPGLYIEILMWARVYIRLCYGILAADTMGMLLQLQKDEQRKPTVASGAIPVYQKL